MYAYSTIISYLTVSALIASSSASIAEQQGHEKPAVERQERTSDETKGSDAGRVSEEARTLVDKVQAFYENTENFSAAFEQTYIYQVGRQVVSRGSVSFKKPAMMRWDYEHPRVRNFIVDGKDLWIYTPEDFTVVRQQGFTASDLSTSITFLWGEGRLDEEFNIELEGEDKLILTPIEPESSFQRVMFKVDTSDGRVLESTVIDPQGNKNQMVFSNVKLNSGLKSELFEFRLPGGVDLQEMPSMQ